jgi:hypothetical protein
MRIGLALLFASLALRSTAQGVVEPSALNELREIQGGAPLPMLHPVTARPAEHPKLKTIVIPDRPLAVDTDGPGRFPRDRWHQGETALEYRDGASLDARKIRYVVLPVKKGWKYWRELRSVHLGDYACVIYNGKSALAVAGDTGPDAAVKHQFGEGSLRLAQDLDALADEASGIDGGVTFVFYPGSNRDGAPRDEAELLKRLADFSRVVGCASER